MRYRTPKNINFNYDELCPIPVSAVHIQVLQNGFSFMSLIDPEIFFTWLLESFLHTHTLTHTPIT